MSALRFLTYNIRLTLEEGFQPVADTIKAINADVVALQEVGNFWPHGPKMNLVEEIARATGYTSYFFAGALFEQGGAYGIGLLSNSPITKISVSEMPRISDEQRVLLCAELPVAHTRIWTTHLSVVKEDRNKQIPWLVKKISCEKPDILLGDLNAPLEDPALAKIPMESSYGPKAPATYPTRAPETTIDHILYGPRYTSKTKADTFLSSASDHLPVFADLIRT